MLAMRKQDQQRVGNIRMKTINVEHLPEPVVRAVQAVVETLRGQFHSERESVDPAKVKAAILARRKASRTLNQDWQHADQEVWAGDPRTRK
jgi:hypothetical protein